MAAVPAQGQGREEWDEAAVVRRAQAGDEGALVCLVEAHEVALRQFCRRLLRDPHVAEDVAQEALLRACVSLPRLGEPYRFGPWLMGIAANLARKRWEERARWPLSLESLRASHPDVPWEAALPEQTGPETAVERAMEATEQTQRLQAAMEALPAPMRDVLALHYLRGLHYDQIATALDVPISTVKGRLFKSRRRLARLLGHVPDAKSASAKKQDKRGARRGAVERKQRMASQSNDGGTLVPIAVERIEDGTYQDKPSKTVWLKEIGGARRMSFVIGVSEGDAMALALNRRQVPRPLTHDLVLSLAGEAGLELSQVAISRQEEDTLYAIVTLAKGRGKPLELDARPSDAINLALRAGAPMFVAEDVLEACRREPEASTENLRHWPRSVAPTAQPLEA